MKIDLPEYFKKVYKLAFITRYSNQVRIKDEDVAQHSFFVAAIVVWLYEVYDFNLETALLAAVCHDMIEAGIGDVTNDIKEKYPKLRKSITEAERIEILEFPRTVQTGYAHFESGMSSASLVARLADALQVQQYCLNEISMGNKHFEKIYFEVAQRIEKLTEELEPYGRR